VSKQQPLESLPNLGALSVTMLRDSGITSVSQLRALGSVAAYARVKARHQRASLNLLWASEGALTNLSWQEVARQHRASLLLSLEQHLRGGGHQQ
jgi:DNA transformation protein